VIAVDANLLIYSSVTSLPQHAASHRWLDRQLNELPRVGLPWASLLAFVRLVSNPRLFPGALSVREAWEHVEAWLSWPSVWIPAPTERHPEILGSLLSMGGMTHNAVPDAHLAALAIEHDLIFCTSDGGFSRFAGLRLENPIKSLP
jgi:toxin-antitoxin system PIN domain toxin